MMTKARTLALIDAILKFRKEATDEQAASLIMLYPVWKEDEHYYEVGDRVRYNEKLYKVLSAHNSKVESSPDVATDLYAEI